jgi:hypothetical protein
MFRAHFIASFVHSLTIVFKASLFVMCQVNYVKNCTFKMIRNMVTETYCLMQIISGDGTNI